MRFSTLPRRYAIFQDKPTLAAWGLILLFGLTFSWLALQHHRAFITSFDLGVYNQVTWNTLQGRPFFYTSTGQPLSHLSNHASPVMALVAPLYLLHRGPETLLILQAFVLGLGGLPLFWLAREKLAHDWVALGLLLAYLLFPGLQVVSLADFHPPALGLTFLMFAFYCLETRRRAWFILFALLAMSAKEQIPLQIIFMGLYAWIRHRDWRLGSGTIAMGIAWFVAVMYWVIPAHSVTGEHIFLDFYARFGDSPAAIVFTVLTRPDLVLQTLLEPARLAYLRDVFTPFAFLPLLGLPILAVGAPSFAINLLSSNPAMFDAQRGHYVADVIPWLAYAALFGLVALRWAVTQFRPRYSRQVVVGGGLLLTGMALTWQVFYGFSPLSPSAPLIRPSKQDRIGQTYINLIPPEAPISAQSTLYPHLSHRQIAYVFPRLAEAEYILVDVTSDTTPLHPNDHKREIQNLLDGNEFGLLAAGDGYLVLEKGRTNSPVPDRFFDFSRVDEAQPQYPLLVEFGEQIRLLGYDLLGSNRRGYHSLRFYWQAVAPIDTPLRLYPFIVNAEGKLIEDTTQRPMSTQLWYPPERWQVGEIVVSQTLPWPLGTRWDVAAGVLAGNDWDNWDQRLKAEVLESDAPLRRFESNTWVRLGSFEQRGQQLQAVAPSDADLQPPQSLSANFDQQMQLFGYEAQLNAADNRLNLTLYWECLQRMGYDYTVFVHVVDENGQVVAQDDSQPTNEVSIPTTTWLPGEKLRARHRLNLPQDVDPADVAGLRVGVYYWQTQARLPILVDGQTVGDYIEFAPGWGD